MESLNILKVEDIMIVGDSLIYVKL